MPKKKQKQEQHPPCEGSRLLVKWRDDNGLSQQAAAIRLSLYVSQISKLENNWLRPGRRIAMHLQREAGIPADSWDHEPASAHAA